MLKCVINSLVGGKHKKSLIFMGDNHKLIFFYTLHFITCRNYIFYDLLNLSFKRLVFEKCQYGKLI